MTPPRWCSPRSATLSRSRPGRRPARRSRAPTRADSAGPTELEVGYTLGRPFWGHGYATEAASAVRDFALEQLGARRLIAKTASETVARKLGFRYERDIQCGRRDAQLFAFQA